MTKRIDEIDIRFQIIEMLKDLYGDAVSIKKLSSLIIGYTDSVLMVLYWRLRGGVTDVEIADKIGINERTVRKIKTGALASFRAELLFHLKPVDMRNDDSNRQYRRSGTKLLLHEPSQASIDNILFNQVTTDKAHTEPDEKKVQQGSVYRYSAWRTGGWDVGRTNPTEYESMSNAQAEKNTVKHLGS